MITDFISQIEIQQRERELVQHVERRRIAAARAAESFGGDRIALVAHWARTARAARTAASAGAGQHPGQCAGP